MEAVNQIRSRFDLSDSAYKPVEFVLPENAVNVALPLYKSFSLNFHI